jgi:hypothetical protein
MDDELDLADAAEYIVGERPELDEDHVWSILREFGAPPAPTSVDLALTLIDQACPEVNRTDALQILREWLAYAALAVEPDWDDED